MDPNETWKILQETTDEQEAVQAARDLRHWLDHGGFYPDGASPIDVEWYIGFALIFERPDREPAGTTEG